MRLVGSMIAASFALAAPVGAEVTASSDAGFISRNAVEVTASAQDAWKTLIMPSGWWNSEHTYSGDAANLSMDVHATGCFCEKLALPKNAPANHRSGNVQHASVIYADPGKVLRLSGALGPLQSEALAGTLTITLKQGEGGKTQIVWEYVVGGYMRYKTAEIAPAVDQVLAEQMGRLAAKLGAGTSAK